MSYKEKQTIVSMLTGVVLLAAYCFYSFGGSRTILSSPQDAVFWARAMLVFIGIGIAAAIVIQIVFHILLAIATAVKEREKGEEEIDRSIHAAMVEDEMDKLIELKSSRIGFAVAGMGFIAGLIALALGSAPVMMLQILFLSFGAGSLAEGGSQIYFYRRGIGNG
jgi:hypothetical protein